MTDWQEPITRRVSHARYVTEQALQICEERPLATMPARHRLACAIQDLDDALTLLDVDDRGLELAEDILHRARQADEPRIIGAGDNRLARALSALDRIRKAIRGDG